MTSLAQQQSTSMRNASKQRCGDKRRASVLLVVVILVMMISLAAYHFVLIMQTEHMAARTNGEYAAVRQAALSGREMLISLLQQPRHMRDELGGLEDNRDLFAGIRLIQEEEDGEEAIGSLGASLRVFLVAADAARGASRAGTMVRFGATNESTKLHLHSLALWDALQPGLGRDTLMRLPTMDEETADALLDWVDDDDDPRLQGAESDVYVGMGLPWIPRNGAPLDLEELLMVRGVDAGRLLGIRPAPPTPSVTLATFVAESDHRAQLDLGNGQRDRPPRETFPPPWTRFLTVYSAERNESYDGIPRIPINDDDLAEVHRQLTAHLPVNLANFVILYRQYGPGVAGGDTVAAAEAAIDFSVAASTEIENPLDLVDTTVAVPTSDGESKQTVASPVDGASSSLSRLVDLITVEAATTIRGRVNVNGATREVLLGVPGIDESLADRIVAARATGGDTRDRGRNDPIWLWREGLIDLKTMRQLLPHITTGGDVYRAELWGVGDAMAPVVRCETIIDASGRAPREVYYRDIPPANADHLLTEIDDPNVPEAARSTKDSI